MISKAWVGAAILVAPGFSASADPITMFGANPPAFFLAQQADTSLVVTSPGFGGGASYQGDTGASVVFSPVVFDTSPAAGDTYTASGPPQAFSYQALDGDTLTAMITWTLINLNLPFGEPQFTGTADITAVSGDAAFKADFPLGDGTVMGNFPFGACIGCPMDLSELEFEGDVLNGGGSPPPPPPPPPPVPEPSTLALIAGALIAAWGFSHCANKRRASGMSSTAI